MRAIKTALIGVTGYAALYVERLLHYHEEGKIAFIAAVVREEAGRKEETQKQLEVLQAAGVEIVSDADTLYAFEPEFVCIPTSIDSHLEYTIQALQHACDVLVEKPAAATPEDVQEMIKARDKAGKNVWVGFQHIYSESTAYLKSWIEGGQLGELKRLTLTGIWPRSMNYFTRNSWAGKLKSDGKWVLDSLINNAFSHHINLALYFTGGDVDALDGFLYRSMPIETFDTAGLQIKTSNGVQLRIAVSHAYSKAFNPAMTLVFDDGKIKWSDEGFQIYKGSQLIEQTTGGDVNTARVQQFQAVINRLHGFRDTVCELETALKLTSLVDRVHSELKVQTLTATKADSPHGLQYIIPDLDAYFIRNTPVLDLTLPKPG